MSHCTSSRRRQLGLLQHLQETSGPDRSDRKWKLTSHMTHGGMKLETVSENEHSVGGATEAPEELK